MHRHWSARVLHALVAVWFVLSVGEPSVAHFCPMHGGTLADLAHATQTMDMGALHGAMHHAKQTGQSGKHAGHHCSCISCCVGAGAAALRSDRVEIAAAWIDDGSITPAADNALPRSASEHAQPLATGPPRV